MMIGIYALKFSGSDKLYIGQSTDIDKRYREHINKLRRERHQPKLQAAYHKYGLPELLILCDNVDPSELDALESEAINAFNSIDNGYNFEKDSSFHGPSLKGSENKRAQYTKEDYIDMFNLLVSTDYSIKELSEHLQINKNVLYQMANGSSHRKWLEPMFPERYKILLSKIGKRNNKYSSTKTVTLVSPEGIDTIVDTGLEEFSIKRGLNAAHLGKVIKGEYPQHKGWTLKFPVN